jgi:hypothetical protein
VVVERVDLDPVLVLQELLILVEVEVEEIMMAQTLELVELVVQVL